MVSAGKQTEVAFSGEAQLADADIDEITLDKRLCTTDNEISLTFFKDYTGPYCQLDCLANVFLKKCRCVPYYFPGD